MRLLITGGCGFIGSNYINYMYERYPEYLYINIDAMYYCSNENNVSETIRSSTNYKLIKGNVKSTDLLTYILEEYKITHVIHFAAQSHVQTSFDDSMEYTFDNIVGTHTLLECVRTYNNKTGNLKKFIHVSTDEVYGESLHDQQKTEQSILCPTNPYAATKAGAELIAQSYIHSYKMPIVITRGNNVYGPNQYPEKLIPKFISQLKNNQKVTIQGDGSTRRSFLHAYDTASAFDVILHKGVIGEIYNIGCDKNTLVDKQEYSVYEIAKILIYLIKKDLNFEDYIEYIEDRPFNDCRYYISNTKLKELGWSITKNFEEEIKSLV